MVRYTIYSVSIKCSILCSFAWLSLTSCSGLQFQCFECWFRCRVFFSSWLSEERTTHIKAAFAHIRVANIYQLRVGVLWWAVARVPAFMIWTVYFCLFWWNNLVYDSIPKPRSVRERNKVPYHRMNVPVSGSKSYDWPVLVVHRRFIYPVSNLMSNVSQLTKQNSSVGNYLTAKHVRDK